MNQRELDLQEIKRIIAEKDGAAVEEYGYKFIEDYSTDEEILLLMCYIFESDWHTRHEDLARSFQYARNPVSASSLFKIAFSNFEHISGDDNYPLQRKCTWALADIGTEEAKNYLMEIEQKANETIAAFATKRLENWDSELSRKGQVLRDVLKHKFHISLEKYEDSLQILPQNGQQIIGNTLFIQHFQQVDYNTGKLEFVNQEYVVVYQAYKPEIAAFAVKNQFLGSNAFSYSRMSWIKPNFLWMMYRCGWAGKENQERVLAIWIKKETFENILQNATFTSYKSGFFATEEEWRKELEYKKVRLQWDPDHDYKGEKLDRKAIQLGLKDELLEKFGKEQIECIMDITDFVKAQKKHIDHNELEKLLVPKERIIHFSDEELMQKVGNNSTIN